MTIRTRIGPNVYTAPVSKGVLFFSYETPVAARVNGRVFRTEESFSSTTTRHINKWVSGPSNRGLPVEAKPQSYFEALFRGEDPDTPFTYGKGTITVDVVSNIFDRETAQERIAILIEQGIFFVWEPFPGDFVWLYVKPESAHYIATLP